MATKVAAPSARIGNISPPCPGIDLTSSQFRPTSSAAQAASLGSPGADELLDKLEDLEAVYHKQVQGHLTLQQGLSKLQVNHDQHVASTRDVFGQVAQLLTTTSTLSDKFQSFEGRLHVQLHRDMAAHKDQWLEAARGQNREFEQQVRRLLGNFKLEVVALTRESETRQGATAAALEALGEKLTRNLEAQDAIRRDHERLMVALEDVRRQAAQQSDATTRQVDLALQQVRDVQGAVRELREDVSRIHENQQNALQLSREETSRKAVEVQEYCDALVTSSLEGLAGELDGKLERSCDKLEASLHKVEGLADELSRRQVEDRQLSGSKHEDVLRLVGKLEGQIASIGAEHKSAHLVVENKVAAALAEIRAAAGEQSEKIIEMDRFMNATDTSVRLAISNFNEERSAIQRLSQGISAQLETTEEMIRTKLVAVSSTERNFLKEQLSRIEQEVDRRHRRLVESTHAAMQELIRDTDTAPQIVELRGELERIREQQAGAAAAASQALQLDNGLESAFTEIKDWLQDVERRMVTRATVEEQLLSFTTQLSNAKAAMQQVELALTQRIDAERAAREHEHSQLSNQLQKVQLMLNR